MQHPALQSRPPGIPAREHAIPGGRADGGAGMSFGKDHSFPCEPVHVRSGYLAAVAAETLDVAVTQVVAQDEDNVRLFCRRGPNCRGQQDSGKTGVNPVQKTCVLHQGSFPLVAVDCLTTAMFVLANKHWVWRR